MKVIQKNNSNEQRGKVIEALHHMQGSSQGAARASATACLQAPQLVETESDPLLFIQDEDESESPAAALRMAIYWSKRFLSFNDKAFRPLNVTGHGALSPADIYALRQSYGCLQLLPAAADTSLGTTVFLIDASKATHLQHDAQVRCLFYQLHRARDSLLSSKQGITFLLLPLDAADLTNLEQLLGVLSVLIGSAGRPYKSRKFHILSAPTSSSSIATVIRQLVQMKTLSDECVVTVGASPEDFLQQLQSDCTVPTGSSSFDGAHTTSTSKGTSEESGTTLAVDDKGSAAAIVYPSSPHMPGTTLCARAQQELRVSTITTQHGTAGVAAVGSASAQENDDMERKPAAKRSGKKKAPPDEARNTEDVPDRKRKPVVSFAQQAPCAKPAANASAMTGFASGPSDDDHQQEEELDPEEAKRKRNALYSKRKYFRKKIEIEVRQNQCYDLHAVNRSLRSEQDRLEQLLARAQECIENQAMPPPPRPPNQDSGLSLSHVPLLSRQRQERQLMRQRQAQQYLLRALTQHQQQHVLHQRQGEPVPLQLLQSLVQQEQQQHRQQQASSLHHLAQQQQSPQHLMQEQDLYRGFTTSTLPSSAESNLGVGGQDRYYIHPRR